MAIALVGTVETDQADDNAQTPAVNTTGANLLIAVVAEHGSGDAGTPSDNKGNTGWIGLTIPTLNNSSRVRIWYHTNAPTVGAGHQFTNAGTFSFSTVMFAAFSGAHATSPFDTGQENGNSTSSTTTIQAGSVTPSVNDCLIIAGLGLDVEDNGISIDESFSTPVGLPQSLTPRGGYLSYKIQTTAGTQNPTWTSTDNNAMTAVLAVFKPAGALGDGSAELTGIGASGQVGTVTPGGGIVSPFVMGPRWRSVRR